MNARVVEQIVVMFSILFSVLGRGGDGVGGAGIAEKHLVLAYLNLGSYIELCLAAEACRLETEERQWLVKIKRDLPKEGTADQLIVFKSESESPGFFMVEGRLRIAKTGNYVGSPIFFNLDLLYKEDMRKVSTPLSLADAVGLLVHELGHHQGIADHLKLDILGSKVQSNFFGQVRHMTGGREFLDIEVYAVDIQRSFSQVWVRDSETIYDLTEKIWQFVQCPSYAPSYGPAGEPPGVEKKVHEKKAGYLWNMHWQLPYAVYGGPSYGGEEESHSLHFSGELRLRASVELECQYQGRISKTVMEPVVLMPFKMLPGGKHILLFKDFTYSSNGAV